MLLDVTSNMRKPWEHLGRKSYWYSTNDERIKRVVEGTPSTPSQEVTLTKEEVRALSGYPFESEILENYCS